MQAAELRQMNRIRWFHRIALGDSVVTPGRDASSEKLASLGLPENLSGKSVLDIGAWDGFFSFEAERRGAARGLSIGSQVWRMPHIGKAGFDFAHQTLNSRAESRVLDVMQLAPDLVGKFDLVLMLGVLYHLPNPLDALVRVASVTADQLILETHVDLLDCPRPAIAFYPGSELNHDKSNWIGPNGPALEGMLHAAGFRRTQIVYESRETYPLAGATPGTYGRMVVHAWR